MSKKISIKPKKKEKKSKEKKEKKPLTEEQKAESSFPLLGNLKNIMDPERATTILEYTKKEFKANSIWPSKEKQNGPVILLANSPLGKRIGTIAEIEELISKTKKKGKQSGKEKASSKTKSKKASSKSKK